MVRMSRFSEFVLLTGRAIRLITPWAFRVVWFMIALTVTSLVTFWSGVPNAVNRIADNWLDQAFAAGFPSRMDALLYNVLWAVAFGMIVVGWFVAAFLTVWLVRALI